MSRTEGLCHRRRGPATPIRVRSLQSSAHAGVCGNSSGMNAPSTPGRAPPVKAARVRKHCILRTSMTSPSAPVFGETAGKRLTITATALVLCITAGKLLVHLYAGRHYGYFIDELYYLACSRHLAWGYVDQPPLIAVITWLARFLLGDSLPAIRFFPAVAGAAEVALAALIARELGGKRFAQGLAALAALVAPGILAADSLLTMNAFEPLFWMGCSYLFIRIVKTGDPRLWVWFGVLSGVGLENKYSM